MTAAGAGEGGGRGAAQGVGPGLEHRILEELIYERVRVTVNLCELVLLERDLDRSIARAMAELDRPGETAGEMARVYIERAWQRLEEEWTALRLELPRPELPSPARCPPPAWPPARAVRAGRR